MTDHIIIKNNAGTIIYRRTKTQERFYDDDGKLRGVTGVNNFDGKLGLWLDDTKPLCEHEKVEIFCEQCKEEK